MLFFPCVQWELNKFANNAYLTGHKTSYKVDINSCDSVKSIRSPAAENFCDTGFANAGDGDAYGKGAKVRL